MALTPTQAAALTPTDIKSVSENESLIDSQLINRYVGPENVLPILVGDLKPKVRAELVRRYEAAGWQVSFNGTGTSTSICLQHTTSTTTITEFPPRGTTSTRFERL